MTTLSERGRRLAARTFESRDEAVDAVLALLAEFLDMSSVFLTSTDTKDGKLRVEASRNRSTEFVVPVGLELPLPLTPCDRVVRSGAVALFDMANEPGGASMPSVRDLGARSYVGVPVVRADGTIYGTLCGLDPRPRHVSGENQDWMIVFARLLAFQIESDERVAQARDQVRERTADVGRLQRAMTPAQLGAAVGRALIASRPLSWKLQRCTEAIVATLDAAFARIWTVDGGGQMLELQASAGLYTHLDGSHARMAIGHFKIGRIAAERSAHLTNDVQHDPQITDHEWARRERMVAFAGHPLLAGDRLVGVVALFARRPLDAADLDAISSVADQMALGIAQAQAEDARAVLIEAEKAARLEAERASRTREDVLAVVSHDLRNPLNSIAISAEVMRHLAAGVPALTKQIEGIDRSAARMGQLINDLLDVAVIDTGRLSLMRRSCSAAAIVRDALDSISPIAAAKSIELRSEAADGLDVDCDRDRVLQVLSNLLGNACKHTAAGGAIRLDVAAVDDVAQFVVSDTGAGIAPEHLPHVFDRYWQARRADRQGIGLGLSIAKGIVEAHGGRIWATSAPGQGSSFFFTLPIG